MKHDIAEWRKYLAIDRHNLDEEVANQPVLFEEVGSAHADAMAERDAAEHNLNVVDGDLFAVLKKSGLTDPGVKAAIEAHDLHNKAKTDFLEAKRQASHWAALERAFIQRADMLKHLCNLHAQGYYHTTSIQAKEPQNQKYLNQRKRLAERRAVLGGT